MPQPSLFDYDTRLSRLSPSEREVYKRVEFDGKEPADVAFETGRTASTTRTLLWRARGKLGERPRGRT